MSKSWQYAWNGEKLGPESPERMQDLIRAGRVKADTLVWSDGMVDWEPAGQHFTFAAAPGAGVGAGASVGASVGAGPASAAGVTPGSRAGARVPGIDPDVAPPLTFAEAIKTCFRKYATFRGRASRSEYWYFTLFLLLAGTVLSVLETAMGQDGQVLGGIFSLVTFLPSISATVRRLHDTDRSGWWVGGGWAALIVLSLLGGYFAGQIAGPDAPSGAMIGILGGLGLAVLGYWVLMLVFMCQRGTPGPNRFG